MVPGENLGRDAADQGQLLISVFGGLAPGGGRNRRPGAEQKECEQCPQNGLLPHIQCNNSLKIQLAVNTFPVEIKITRFNGK
ncbi:hypothetical protein SDC9_146587 [bioreactor metagenome]|uniref:Uncharacterized protein n=1 Tax=bioreactor metagenome TaxID=1076179 RepID=A0A645ECH3_9ZZZZ